MKSIHPAARQLELLHSTVHKVLHKNLRLYAYKAEMLQALQPNDKPRQKEFAVNMLQRISEDEAFLKRVGFSDAHINVLNMSIKILINIKQPISHQFTL